MYCLFLDDIRFPEDINLKSEYTIIIARNMDDAVWYTINYGIPNQISFDHDLGFDHYIINKVSEKTGYDFVKWFGGYIIENKLKLPKDFKYQVHSQNPIGKENIEKYMKNLLKFLEKG